MPPVFHPFGTSHQAALLFTALVLVLMRAAARTRFARLTERTLGTMLLLLFPATFIVHLLMGSLTTQTCLPLQYCDIAAIAGGLALWTRRAFWCEVVYFFGLAGTFQGLITPSLQFNFPDPRFFAFFGLHGGVSIAALYVVTGMRYRPPPGVVGRMMLFSLSWYAVAAVINLMLGTNYAFQRLKPLNASLFDHLGPWPWYNLSAVLLGPVIYTLLYLPFALRRRKA